MLLVLSVGIKPILRLVTALSRLVTHNGNLICLRVMLYLENAFFLEKSVLGRLLSYFENFKKNQGSKHWLWFNNVEFTTLASHMGAELKALFSQKPFYMNSKKAIPDNIGIYMTALVFAVMLGDDGKTKHQSGYYELCLQSYSSMELSLLNQAINTQLGLNGRVVTH